MPAPALSVKNLTLSHAGLRLVHPLTFSIQPRESVALLGASGSGKSLTASGLTGTVPEGITVSGEISFGATPAACGSGTTAKGAGAALISQDPQISLNPLVPVGRQLMIPLRRTGLSGSVLHRAGLRGAGLSRSDAFREAQRLLSRAGLANAAEVMARYTGELSGGELQRVCIALALACRSSILVADEPTTALDAVTRQTVLATLGAWVSEGRSLLFITHDLPAAAALCSRAVVMDGGRIVEDAPMAELLRNPQHPYTKRLVQSARATSLPFARAASGIKVGAGTSVDAATAVAA